MTRRLVMVNMSNYEDEDYRLVVGQDPMEEVTVVLAPGEYVEMSHHTDKTGRVNVMAAEVTNLDEPHQYTEPIVDL